MSSRDKNTFQVLNSKEKSWFPILTNYIIFLVFPIAFALNFKTIPTWDKQFKINMKISL